MRVFITGASGFVGGAVTRRLVSASHTVLAMARSDASTTTVRALGATPVPCDLLSVTASDLSGCSLVIHCAALVRDWGSDADFHAANVTGTATLLRAAQAAGVIRFIHIGTEAACFAGQDMSDMDESTPLALASPFPYARTKAQAERLVVAANSPPTLTTLVLRPRMIWGPGDTVVLPSLLRFIAQGKFRWIDGGQVRTSTCHIDNLVRAVELAMDRGVGGEAYFIVDEGALTFREFASRLVATQGVEVDVGEVPSWVVKGMARVVEPVWGWLWPLSPPPVSRFVANLGSVSCTLRTDKAKRELGWQPVITREEGLRTLPKLNSSSGAMPSSRDTATASK